jgi:hypothetical protein
MQLSTSNARKKLCAVALAAGAVLSVGAAATASAATAGRAPVSRAPAVAAAAKAAVAGSAWTGKVRPATPATEGCPLGDVCLYPENAGWNNGQPEYEYYKYGVYNLSNVFGTHRFFNNQTGGAKGAFCTGYNASGTCYYQPPGTWSDDNFTPINSILLAP